MAKKQELTRRWILAPHSVDTNQDTTLIKLIAMASMLCDHAGKMLFPQYRILRIIGRLAMPLFAYCIATGCVYTKNPLRYLRRVVLLALISQPIYAVSMAHETTAMYRISFMEKPILAALNFYVESWHHPGILLTFSAGILSMWALREKQFTLFLATALLCWKLQSSFDYGIRCIILMLLFYLLCQKWWLSLPIVTAYMIWWGLQGSGFSLFGVSFGLQMFAVPALALIYPRMKTGLRLPKWFFYAFYPAHFAVIWVIDHFIL